MNGNLCRTTAVLLLTLSCGLGLTSLAHAARPVTPSVTIEVMFDFDFTLQPGEWHGFSLGPVEEERGYVAEVTPLGVDADDGAHIVSRIQPEFNTVAWYDVLRVQLFSSVPLDVNIRVYAMSEN